MKPTAESIAAGIFYVCGETPWRGSAFAGALKSPVPSLSWGAASGSLDFVGQFYGSFFCPSMNQSVTDSPVGEMNPSVNFWKA